MDAQSDAQRQMLRHTLATLAYRSGKALRGAPASFSSFSAGEGMRLPGKILAHMGDLMDWGLSMANGAKQWRDSPVQPWDADVARYFAAVKAFDDYLASDAPLQSPAEKLFQGPIADSLSHTGQISILRRLAGVPIKSENYFKAAISAGAVGIDQAPPKFEFD